jgi:four helix bundle protein
VDKTARLVAGKISMKNSKFQVPSSKEIPMSNLEGEVSAAWELREGSVLPSGKPYDLEERTALFGESVIRIANTISRGPGNDRLINQLVGAGTSLGANYAEASETVSRKDFKYAISRCVKEAKETRIFLRMVAAAEPQRADEARNLYREARELHLIFVSMYRK